MTEIKKDGIRDDKGRYISKEFFYEYRNAESTIIPKWTLKRYNLPEYKSAYLLYMDDDTINDYDFAMKFCGSYEQFKKMLEYKWFYEGDPNRGFSGFKSWQEEKTLKEEMIVKSSKIALARAGNVQALKMWDDGLRDKKRGRPSKEEVNRSIEKDKDAKNTLIARRKRLTADRKRRVEKENEQKFNGLRIVKGNDAA
jgi:hypothetical protein